MVQWERLNKNPEFYRYMTQEEDERKINNSRMYEAEQKGLVNGLKQGIEKTRKFTNRNHYRNHLFIKRTNRKIINFI